MPSSTKASPRWPRQYARVASAANCPLIPAFYWRTSAENAAEVPKVLHEANASAIGWARCDRYRRYSTRAPVAGPSRQRYLGLGCRSTSLGAFRSGRRHCALSRNQARLRNRLRPAKPPLGMGGDFQWPVALALLRARHRWVVRSDVRMGSHRLPHRSVDCLAILLPLRTVALSSPPSYVVLRRPAKSRPTGRLQTGNCGSSVDDGRGRTRTGHEPDERDDAPSDQGIDRHRDQRLRLEDRPASLCGVEDAVDGRHQRPGQGVHEADKWTRSRAEQLQHETNRNQDIDETDDPPDGLDRTAVVAALAVDRRPRRRGGRYGRDRRDGPHRLAGGRLLSDDFSIV